MANPTGISKFILNFPGKSRLVKFVDARVERLGLIGSVLLVHEMPWVQLAASFDLRQQERQNANSGE